MGSLISALHRIQVDITPFTSLRVYDAMLAIKNNVRLTPNQRLPVPHEALALIMSALKSDPQYPTIICAMLIMFYTFLRQSNIAPRTKKAFDRTQHLTRSDVLLHQEALVLAVKWTKTRQGPTASTVAAPEIQGSILCPVATFKAMVAHVPTIGQHQPLLCFRDTSPMPLSYINKAWNWAMAGLGFTDRQYMLHSLRRGGVMTAFESGRASLEHIKIHGTWKLDAVKLYLPNDPT